MEEITSVKLEETKDNSIVSELRICVEEFEGTWEELRRRTSRILRLSKYLDYAALARSSGFYVEYVPENYKNIVTFKHKAHYVWLVKIYRGKQDLGW